MNPRPVLLVSFLSIIFLFSAVFPPGAYAGEIRRCIAAGTFYPDSSSMLNQLIENYTEVAAKTSVGLPEDIQIRAVIIPHAGYVYSGLTAAHAANAIRTSTFSKVIVMGPDHRIGFKNACISSVDAYETPLGLLRLHDDANRLRQEFNIFQAIEASDRYEHSIEVVLPFLQYCLGDFTFIPIVMGPGGMDIYVSAIESVMDDKTLLVASSDLSHYLRYDHAVKTDKETIEMIVNLREDALLKNENRACGIVPIRVVVSLARRRGWKAILVHYSNSGDTAGSKDRVVGYAAIVFYGGPMEKTFDDKQGQALVKLARRTIQQQLGIEAPGSDVQDQSLVDDAFQTKRGVFVTLNMNGQLRGCIGSLESRESVVEGVKHNAVNAAFHDPRFRPVKRAEMDDMDIEVSILSEPKPLEYTDYHDLLKKIRPGVDGVIIKYGMSGATFLPQVWEQLADKEEFLSHLCAKAGLHAYAWKDHKLEVLTYQVQYFEEHK
jgi:AmmeMemoRadiSam system protein B/AmmeMemoRadiSam system protein A